MTNADLYNIPILAPRNAEVGLYTEGQVFFTEYGKVYTYKSPSDKLVRISRKSMYQLYYFDNKYINNDTVAELDSYRVSKTFTIEAVIGGVIHLGQGIFSNRPPF